MTNPLPYWGCWNTGEFQRHEEEDRGYSPEWQSSYISDGYHIHPTFEIPFRTMQTDVRAQRPWYWGAYWDNAKNENLSLTLIGTNLEDGFRQLSPWKDMLPGEPHPFIETEHGSIIPLASPWNKNVHHWYDYGVRFGEWLSREFAQDYPDCPYIYIGNNNEIGRARPEDAVKDIAMPDMLRNRLATELNYEISIAYALRRSYFVQGMNKACPEWAGRIFIHAYSESGTEHQRVEVDETQRRYRYPWAGPSGDIEWLGFHATINTGYIHNWSDNAAGNLKSPAVKACNSRFGLNLYEPISPGTKFETHFWNGVNCPPDTWQGVVRSVLWIMRTEQNRLFLGASQTVADTFDQHMKPFIDAVEEVYDGGVLERFWQHGELLTNRWSRDLDEMPLTEYEAKKGVWATGYGHPYQWTGGAPSETVEDPANRWFLQTTNKDNRLQFIQHPSGSRWDHWVDRWKDNRSQTDPLNVIAVCLKHEDEHLLFVCAPNGTQTNVEVTITTNDDTFKVSIPSVSPAGNFMHRNSAGLWMDVAP